MTPVVSSPALDQRGTGALARKVGPAIVRLDVVSGDGARSSVSGVVFRDDGLILTSALPLRGATTITAVLSDGRQLDASVRGLDDATDVAVVDVDADQLEVAVLEIGRASCRESVGQYVEISVVAVSLNKKKETNKR